MHSCLSRSITTSSDYCRRSGKLSTHAPFIDFLSITKWMTTKAGKCPQIKMKPNVFCQRKKGVYRFTKAHTARHGNVLGLANKVTAMFFADFVKLTFSIGSGAGNDITRHVKSKKHQEIEKVKTSKSNTAITAFFSPSSGRQLNEDANGEHSVAVTRAEVMMCELLVHHNLPLAAADTWASGFKHMFPDSKIAAGM